MTRICRTLSVLSLVGLSILSFSGCGSQSSDGDSANSSTQLPTAAITTQKTSDQKQVSQANRKTIQMPSAKVKEKGSPEWTLRQISTLRSQPLFTAKEDATATAEERSRRQAAKQNQIIQLSGSVIAVTHNDASKKFVFESAVNSLMDARLQLAITGNQKEIAALYEDADALFKANPQSRTASVGAFTLIRLTETLSKQPNADQRWVGEYAKQTKNYALNFPKEESRAVVALISAGQFCESQGDLKNGFECYSIVAQKFSHSPFADRANAAIRRLTLPGKKLALEGETIDGAFLSMDNYKGKVVLVAFWDSHSEQFQEDLPLLKTTHAQWNNKGFEILSVCMDDNEAALKNFLKTTTMPGKQLFNTKINQRRFNHPVVRFYDIKTIPTYWLIDKEGTVRSIRITPSTLSKAIEETLN